MTREEIISGLQFTIDMFLFEPNTGEMLKEPRNDMDKTTIDACKGAIELLMQEPCEDAISREDAIMCMTGEYIADMTYKPDDIISKHVRRLRALPSVQPKLTECEDAISRQAALEALEQEEPLVWCDGTDEIAARDQWASDVDTIKNMPSVQPKPSIQRNGKWVDDGGLYRCSICNHLFSELWWVSNCPIDRMNKIMRFCPNCGAKMESER